MQRNRLILSIIVGFLIPLPVVLSFSNSGESSPPMDWKSTAFAVFLLTFGVALWRPLVPFVYCLALAPSFCIWLEMEAIATSQTGSNLLGLGLILSLLGGLVIATFVGAAAYVVRRWP